jgi:parallel beta-helix repeat protein
MALALLAALILLAAPATAAETTCRRCVIAADTVWDGAVLIEGQAVVKKGATLTLSPGTTVRFAWTDEDADGIGDGELRVEGRLLARGTRERPIVFTSAREAPAPKDWTFVILNLSRGSVIERCVFEYAFTGLQLHFTTAEVRNNVFRRNFEALRFSTAEVRIERNDIVDNAYGIRYEARGSATTVAGNRIAGNEYGFFPVIRSGGGATIAGNCVESLTYNVKVGEEQREDVDFAGNWWGTAEPERIEAGFFDKRREPALGRVLYKPFLEKAVEECGVER